MSGHVFVVGADLTRLACDDVLVPTDRSLRVARGWCSVLPDELITDRQADGDCVAMSWTGDERVLEVPGDGPRRAWLVDTVDGGPDGTGSRGLSWLLDGAREALAAVARREVHEPVHGRARRLVGLPALGTGWGGAAGERGALLQQLLPVLREAADEHGFDVALVLRRPSDLAAAQRVRRGEEGGWELPGQLRELAVDLGERARRGQLAVFIGAGVSAAAGLPTWEQLVDELATRSGLDDALRAGLAGLPAQDAAALLARELGAQELAAFVERRFGPGPYALAHALIADLPVQEFVTTNYDPLVELAAGDIGRQVTVLPHDEARPGSPWLLKLHGDAAHPESVVLTREEYLQFGNTGAALAGVLHSLLLTRHVLFVGTSMLDDDLIRIAHQVRTALQTQGSGTARRTGTVLALQEDPARARLWEQDVETVAMCPAEAAPAEAARRLEVLLDLIGCLSTPPTGYLLDPAYRGLLDEEERVLADALAAVPAALPRDASSTVGQEVAGLLRRLGHGSCGGDGAEPPADVATRPRDDRTQEQRPG
ncbi:SIR2 family protein [Blastococcus sp. MG754426]|uniref:SIR2 family NAD-dependent protein deacylase n=1 Tax=unclassified Blastococcus TaxID=2619396 RepID=UPI001EF00DEB|nr:MULTISPECIES: SIR2 family protein [unclassified Blastococcus]MCF6509763.1 SIR2 family protein [Blastococcus sp. MG754426]MCF6514158.1 SIR2 family protein [Blastococcus sp. MG754427]MCF6737267.1 SIR2 family protein [Blastococcus sp. KM273129]